MNVRWNAVLLGVVVDFTLTLLISALGFAFGTNVNFGEISFQRAPDVVMLALGLLATVAGGYAAGTLARESFVLNGAMVGVVDIVLLAFQSLDPVGTTGARIGVLLQLAGCLAGALGGYLSRLRLAPR